MGENLSKHLDKGSRVCVDGYLRWESWEKEGVKHSRLYLNADSVQFLDVKKDGQAAAFDSGAMTEEPPF